MVVVMVVVVVVMMRMEGWKKHMDGRLGVIR
jgi:hypothetical protein